VLQIGSTLVVIESQPPSFVLYLLLAASSPVVLFLDLTPRRAVSLESSEDRARDESDLAVAYTALTLLFVSLRFSVSSVCPTVVLEECGSVDSDQSG